MAPGPQHPAAGGDQEAYTLSQRGLRPDGSLRPEAQCSVLPGMLLCRLRNGHEKGPYQGLRSLRILAGSLDCKLRRTWTGGHGGMGSFQVRTLSLLLGDTRFPGTQVASIRGPGWTWPSLFAVFLGPLGGLKSNRLALGGVFRRGRFSGKHHQPHLIKKKD